MTLKTLGLVALLFRLGAPAPAAQKSPLQWPVPPPGPPRQAVLPHLLIGVPELARALRPRPAAGAASTVPIDARGAAPFTAGHLPGAVPAWSAVAIAVAAAAGRDE